MNPRIPELSGQLDAIIFDFGGVLFDIDYQAPAQAFAKWGIANFDQLYSKASQSDIFDRLETGLATESELFDHIRTTTGVNLTDEQIREAWNAILIGLPTPRVLWLNQVHPLFRTFILSNTNAIHAREFEHMIDQHAGWRNFAEGFEEVVYSHVLGARKPHVETFELMLKRHHLNPKRTLFIDDSKQHVEGARKAGLMGYYLDLNVEQVEDVVNQLLY